MNITSFVEKQQEIQRDILEFLDNATDDQDILQKLEKYKFSKDQKELKIFLYFIVNICNNHQHLQSFFLKIEKILQFFKSEIIQNFSNSEIFHIFRSNKRILLYLFEEKVFNLDQDILKTISFEKYQYNDYFNNSKDIEFNKKCKIGENDSYICQLIREDSIIEFIQYVNRTNMPLSSTINESIFETNSLLKKHDPSLIEYSLFYGSIQIFQYLINNKVQINSKLWPYAIHGRNAEIIHIFEEHEIEPDISCIKESIKCHHNEITEYFLINNPNLITKKSSYLYFGIKYYNFEYFPKSLNDDFLFYYLCEYDYYFFVENLLLTNTININYLKKAKTTSHASTSVNVSAKKMNLDILFLLMKQRNFVIRDFCFYKCDELKKISIPSSVKSIGNSAFSGCSSLTQITIPSSIISIGNYAFSDCSSLVQVTVPSSVAEIGDHSFSECSSLTQITIPSKEYYLELIEFPPIFPVFSIGNSAFNECSSLTQLIIPSSVTSIGDSAFSGCSSLAQITIPSSVTSIGNYAFNGCSSLTQITIPSSVKKIGESAFHRCSSLTQITILSSITSIGDSVFNECSSLEQITIPSSVTKICSYAFNGCSSLTQITIPSSVTKIGDSAFRGCSSLEQITIPSSVTSIKKNTFRECSSLKEVIFEDNSSMISFGRYAFTKCISLAKIIIPPSLVIIKRGCFTKCTSLVNISIPSSVLYIDCFAFNGCSSLKNVDLSSSLKVITKCTFKKCTSLKKIIIPGSIKRICSYAFFECQSLLEVIVLPSNAKIEELAFPYQALVIQFNDYNQLNEEDSYYDNERNIELYTRLLLSHLNFVKKRAKKMINETQKV